MAEEVRAIRNGSFPSTLGEERFLLIVPFQALWLLSCSKLRADLKSEDSGTEEKRSLHMHRVCRALMSSLLVLACLPKCSNYPHRKARETLPEPAIMQARGTASMASAKLEVI